MFGPTHSDNYHANEDVEVFSSGESDTEFATPF